MHIPEVSCLARCGHRDLGGARIVDVSMVAFPPALVSLSCLSLPLLPVLLLRCWVAHLLSVIPQSFHWMSPTSLGTLGRKTLATFELCRRMKLRTSAPASGARPDGGGATGSLKNGRSMLQRDLCDPPTPPRYEAQEDDHRLSLNPHAHGGQGHRPVRGRRTSTR